MSARALQGLRTRAAPLDLVLASLALAGLALVAVPAWAENPRPRSVGASDAGASERGASDAGVSEATSDDEQVEEPREYSKPTPRPLPEGPARVLEGPILRVHFEGIVNPGMGEYVITALERAEREEAQAVLIEIDTPGGLVSTTEKIVQAILSARVPVLVHVTPSGAHAASAGTFITLAGHVAAMAPATRIGAAHPVTGGGKDPEAEGGKHMGRKVENDLAAFVEGIAKERNRNVEWAVDAVRNSVSANADRALEIGVIDLIARDRAELLEALDGRELLLGTAKVQLRTRGARVVDHEPSLRQRLLNVLANPGVAMVLLLLGVLGITIEMYHPGFFVPGVMGVLCTLCSLIAMDQLPIDLGGAILIVVGIGLLVAEMYASTYGLLGILGALGLAVGLTLLIDTEDPGYLVDDSFALGFADVLPFVATLVLFFGYLSYLVVRRQRSGPVTGSEGMLGSRGEVLSEIGPEGGMVLVHGEYWRAQADEPIAKGEAVEVVGVTGLMVTVKRART